MRILVFYVCSDFAVGYFTNQVCFEVKLSQNTLMCIITFNLLEIGKIIICAGGILHAG